MKQGYPDHKPLFGYLYKLIALIIIAVLLLHQLNLNSSLFYRKFYSAPFSLHLNKQELYLVKGEEFHLYVFGLNKRVSFSSTNFRVAGVNFNGRVFAYQTGKAFILAKVDHKVLKCRVHVVDINKKTLKLHKGQSYHLKIKGTNSFVSWKCSHKEIAKVSMFGNVKAISRGSTVVYGKVKGRKLTCTIVVE